MKICLMSRKYAIKMGCHESMTRIYVIILLIMRDKIPDRKYVQCPENM